MDHLPPLTFYDGAVLDLDGGRRARLDLERSALIPITDAARVFALAHGRLDPPGTLDRLAAAGLDEAANAYRVSLFYHTVGGTLSRYDQMQLKTAFVSIQRLLDLTAKTFLS